MFVDKFLSPKKPLHYMWTIPNSYDFGNYTKDNKISITSSFTINVDANLSSVAVLNLINMLMEINLSLKNLIKFSQIEKLTKR